jgi:hypothetical protein
MRRLLLIAFLALIASPASAESAKKKTAEKVIAEKAKGKADTKSTAKGSVTKAAAAKSAPGVGGAFDPRDPDSLVALLGSMDANATVAQRNESTVKLQVATPNYSFGAEFVDCSAGGKGCKGLAFTASSQDQRATLAQLNSFNQTSITCRLFQDRAGKAHVLYSTLLSAGDTREEMRTHLGAWQGCLASFGAFLQDPNGYLATAP